VPLISEFYGISIYIYYSDHPQKHFHAQYGGNEVKVRISDLSIMAGRIAPRAMGLVIEWAGQHQSELEQAWNRAAAHEKPGKIAPLK
jgi:hypothetical protein